MLGSPLEPLVAVDGITGVHVVEAVGESCSVGEEVPNSHWFDCGNRGVRRGGSTGVDPGIFERRDVPLDRVAQFETPLFKERHEHHRGDGLGHGVDPEQGVCFDGELASDVAVSAGSDVNNFPFAGNAHEVAGDLPLGDVGIEVAIDAMESRRIEPKFFCVSGNRNGGSSHGGSFVECAGLVRSGAVGREAHLV